MGPLLSFEFITLHSIKKPPRLDLKPLPDSLKYVCLGSSKPLSIIIASDLDNEQEGKLIRVLKDHKEAIWWSIIGIKGISPLVCA